MGVRVLSRYSEQGPTSTGEGAGPIIPTPLSGDRPSQYRSNHYSSTRELCPQTILLKGQRWVREFTLPHPNPLRKTLKETVRPCPFLVFSQAPARNTYKTLTPTGDSLEDPEIDYDDPGRRADFQFNKKERPRNNRKGNGQMSGVCKVCKGYARGM